MSNMGDSMDFLITLDQFEGPLDLMLGSLTPLFTTDLKHSA